MKRCRFWEGVCGSWLEPSLWFKNMLALEGALGQDGEYVVWWGTPVRVGVGWCIREKDRGVCASEFLGLLLGH